MFGSCTNLTEAPELPATILADKCYYEMFRGCTSLIEAPVLPAKEMVTDCYSGMFYGCNQLKSVTTYATTWISYYSWDWLWDVSSNGDFYNYGEADIPAGPDGIPYNWVEHFYDDVDETESSTLWLYPNPANTNAAIFMPTTYDKVEVFSTTGAKVAEYNNTDKISDISVSGTYIIKAILNVKISNQRLIVK